MKKLNFLSLVAVFVILCGCSGNSGKIQYLPCKVDKGDDWGFVNAKGEVFCKDAFKECPSVVRDGVFFVREGDYYSLYKFDSKKPVLLMEDIIHQGNPRNGIFPICKKDSHIEIIDTKGVTKFTLEKVENQEVVGCAAGYSKHGYLKVETMDDNGDEFWGVIDEKGKTVLKPKYSSIRLISSNLFYVGIEEDDEVVYQFVNKKGEKLSQWKEMTLCDAMSVNASDGDFQYVCGIRDERCYIYDLKGEEVMKCSEKVEDILDINKKCFVFEGENGYGVMDFKGEKILSDKYQHVQLLENGEFIVHKDYDHKYEWLDKKGESIKMLSDYDNWVSYLDNFGLIASDNHLYYILNDKFEQAEKTELYDIECPTSSYVESDFFDYGVISDCVKKLIESGLQERRMNFGNSVTDIPSVVAQGVDEFRSYSSSAQVELLKRNKFSVYANLYFDGRILEPIYTTKTVQKYSYWYGYYNTTERVVDGYRFSDDAELSVMTINCNVPYAKRENMNKELTRMLKSLSKSKNSDLRDNQYLINNMVFTMDDCSIRIDVYNDYDYAVAEEFAPAEETYY